MYELRKGNGSDNKRILKVANSSFATVREAGFDFRKIMPKVYGADRDFAAIHHVIEEDGEIVSLAGNLPSVIKIGERTYPFSVVGTVSTLPESRNKGYMTVLMNSVVKESVERGYVFGVLTGLRNRYRRFGFDKYTTLYKFEIEQDTAKYLKKDADVCLNIYDGSTAVSSQLYDLYLKTNPYVERKREDFIDCLKVSDAEILVFYYRGEICGYASFSKRKVCVQELVLNDLSLLPAIVSAICSFNGFSKITFKVNPTDSRMVEALGEISEQKALCDYLHIRVFDTVRFLDMLLRLNISVLANVRCEEKYRIDGQTIYLKVDCGKVEVGVCATQGVQEYTQSQFLNMALGGGDNALCRNSQIFPLRFGINDPDMF